MVNEITDEEFEEIMLKWDALGWWCKNGYANNKEKVYYYLGDILLESYYYIGTLQDIAKETNVSEKTVRQTINRMKEIGLIVQTGSNIYRASVKINGNLYVSIPEDCPISESEKAYYLKHKYKEKQESSNIINTNNTERAKLNLSLRYKILQRDHFRCQICGATQADGVRLEVDHIKPVSKGGKTEPDNLRTLCHKCNIGKGNKYIPDSEYN